MLKIVKMRLMWLLEMSVKPVIFIQSTMILFFEPIKDVWVALQTELMQAFIFYPGILSSFQRLNIFDVSILI